MLTTPHLVNRGNTAKIKYTVLYAREKYINFLSCFALFLSNFLLNAIFRLQQWLKDLFSQKVCLTDKIMPTLGFLTWTVKAHKQLKKTWGLPP